MPPTPQKPPESHYDIQKLHKFFAFAALTLLFALFGLFAKDYSREWKKYQQQFRELEVEKTKVKLELETQALAKNEEFKKIEEETASAEKSLEAKKGEIAVLRKHAESIQATINILTQQSQFAKAELDTIKYDFEVARDQRSPKAPAMEKRINDLIAKVERLRVQIEEKKAQQDAENNKIKTIEKQAKDLEKQRSKIAQRSDLLKKKLGLTDMESMNLSNRVANAVRDLPIIELANSNYRIKQIVLKEITDDVNFMRVPKVDRCITCHLGIDNPDFKDAPQPLRTHPNLELYLSKNSPHAIEEFACTTCHLGRGRATGFVSAAHTPRNEEQRQEWEKKYQWKEDHHWETPMLPAGFMEASCFKCHSHQEVIKGAEKLNLGLNLIERAGCYNCHTIEKYKDWPKTGPSLVHIGSKLTPEWTYRWIDDPQSIRPNTWMPSFFHLSNNDDPASIARSQQEIHAIVEFLFANSKPFDTKAPDLKGDAAKGEELVSSIGCFGCHQIHKDAKKDRNRKELLREHGPNLVGLGTKTSKEWLYNWLKNPKRYHPESRMPDLRLTDQEAMDVAEFLSQDTTKLKAVPMRNDKIIDQIVYDFMVKNSSVAESKKQIASMSQKEKLQFAGKRLIRQYGCFSCHDISGFENEKPIGAELTEEGSKSLHGLDFGLVHMEHTKEAWFKLKVLDPRIYDEGKLRTADEKLRMPNFHFSDSEAEAITTALMGFVKDRPAPTKMSPRTPERIFVEEGQKIVRQFNCQGCHIMQGEGGAIQDTVTDWLVKYQEKDPADAKALTLSFSPPNLIGEGQKVHAEWLFEFIHSPETIRPWLSVRMPTYHFNSGRLNGLLKYFNYLDNSDFPFADIYNPHDMKPESIAAGAKLFSKEYFGCASCHIVGDQMPPGAPDSWAPNFAMAKKRLRPEWIAKWLENPQDLLPGTKMPTYYDPKAFDTAGPEDVLNGDEKAQIRALRDYVLTLSGGSTQTPSSAPSAPMKPADIKEPAAPAASPEPAAAAAPAETEKTGGDDFWAEEPAKK